MFDIETVFSEQEKTDLYNRLGSLLMRQTQIYNGTDSTSVTTERAQELLGSLVYTINVLMADGVSKKFILEGDPDTIIRKGREVLQKKKKAVKIDYKLMLEDAPLIRNYFYMDTIRNLELFFKNYELYFEAHQIPCSIDYPLMCPIPESVKGINFIEEYIRRLQTENDLIGCFDPQTVLALYDEVSPDIAEEYLNLCEPVMNNAVGLKLASASVRGLSVSSGHMDMILELVKNSQIEDIRMEVENAVIALCRDVGMDDPDVTAYFKEAMAGLPARLSEAAKTNDLSNIFISF